jgi:hypothetical protein
MDPKRDTPISPLSLIGSEVMKMLAIRPTMKAAPRDWTKFNADDPDDLDRLTDWLIEQVFLGKTAAEISEDMGVAPIVVNRLIAARIHQDQLAAMFAVGQNLAKARILADYDAIITKLTQALKATSDPSLIQKIANTMSSFADLKPPDPKLLTSVLTNEQDPKITEDFRLLEKALGTTLEGCETTGEDNTPLEVSPATPEVPGAGQRVLSEEYLSGI